MTGRITPLWFAALLLPALACGGSPPAEDGADEQQQTTGAEAEPDATVAVAEDPILDPCAEGTGEPCPEEGVDSPGGEITEGSGTDAQSEEGAAEGEEPEGTDESSDQSPAEARRAWRNQVGAGRAVFDRVCGICHPEGEEDIGPDIRGKRFTERRVTTIIRVGMGEMDAIPQRKLPDRYMDELMAYLSTLGTVRGVQRPR